MSSASEWVNDRRCFVCGPHNPDGLHLAFERDGDDGARSTVTLPPRVQGWRGVAHGGVAMMLLDEVMAYACIFSGDAAVTASCEARLRKPVPLGQLLVLRGRIKERRRKLIYLEATLALEDGTLLATADGTFVSVGKL
jgi:acyl-coenzyme A thioesterase PaaI-like protein